MKTPSSPMVGCYNDIILFLQTDNVLTFISSIYEDIPGESELLLSYTYIFAQETRTADMVIRPYYMNGDYNHANE
jgi:hypothetical protein